MINIYNLCPLDFSLQDLDEELTCIAMIRALPEEYSHFTSSLMLLGSLKKDQLREAFLAKELNCHYRAEAYVFSPPTALAVSDSSSISGSKSTTCPHFNYQYCNQTKTNDAR